MLQNCQNDLTKVLQETIVDFCQKNLPRNFNLEIYGLVCIGVIGSQEQAVLKIHKIVRQDLMLCQEPTESDRPNRLATNSVECANSYHEIAGVKTWKCQTCHALFGKFKDFESHAKELHSAHACEHCAHFTAVDKSQHHQPHSNRVPLKCLKCNGKLSATADLSMCDVSSSTPARSLSSNQNNSIDPVEEVDKSDQNAKGILEDVDMGMEIKREDETSSDNILNNLLVTTGLLSPSSPANSALKSTPLRHAGRDEVESGDSREERDRTFECCSSTWVGFRSYESHFIANHSRYPCPLCRQTFTSRNNMRRHVNCNHGERRKFECSICEKHFTRPDIVKEHKLTHTRSYKSNRCSMCEFVSNKKTTLLTHLKKCLKYENIEQDIGEQ